MSTYHDNLAQIMSNTLLNEERLHRLQHHRRQNARRLRHIDDHLLALNDEIIVMHDPYRPPPLDPHREQMVDAIEHLHETIGEVLYVALLPEGMTDHGLELYAEQIQEEATAMLEMIASLNRPGGVPREFRYRLARGEPLAFRTASEASAERRRRAGLTRDSLAQAPDRRAQAHPRSPLSHEASSDQAPPPQPSDWLTRRTPSPQTSSLRDHGVPLPQPSSSRDQPPSGGHKEPTVQSAADASNID